MSLFNRLARLEAIVGDATKRTGSPRDMSDEDLWLIILESAGLPPTQENVTAHIAYNADRLETLLVHVDGAWTNLQETRPNFRRPQK